LVDAKQPLARLCLVKSPGTGRRDSGASAANRSMNTRFAVLSCQGLFSFSTTCPAALHCTRSVASAGRVM
jgi:hypothetical protein